MTRVIGWTSGGVPSAVMVKLALKDGVDVLPVNCDMRGSEDEDNERFLDDCEGWFGRSVLKIGSMDFDTIDDVFEAKRFHSSFRGAPCTTIKKRVPRLEFQRPGDVHLFGYTADARDNRRFENFKAHNPGLIVLAPLIAKGLTRDACFALLERADIAPPRVYSRGFPNGNCPGCVKGESPDYWAAVRFHYPDVFARRADQSRRFGSKLCVLRGERIHIDDLPADWPVPDKVYLPSCDFLCHLAGQDMAA